MYTKTFRLPQRQNNVRRPLTFLQNVSTIHYKVRFVNKATHYYLTRQMIEVSKNIPGLHYCANWFLSL